MASSTSPPIALSSDTPSSLLLAKRQRKPGTGDETWNRLCPRLHRGAGAGFLPGVLARQTDRVRERVDVGGASQTGHPTTCRLPAALVCGPRARAVGDRGGTAGRGAVASA